MKISYQGNRELFYYSNSDKRTEKQPLNTYKTSCNLLINNFHRNAKTCPFKFL